MKVSSLISLLEKLPQDKEVFLEDYYSVLSPIGSVWFDVHSDSIVVSQYDCLLSDSDKCFYLRDDFKLLHHEKDSSSL